MLLFFFTKITFFLHWNFIFVYLQVDEGDENDQDWGSDITGVADNQELSEDEDVNTVRFSANVLTFSEMHQQKQLQRIVGYFGFVAIPANPVAPVEHKARPASRPAGLSPEAAFEIDDSPDDLPDVGGGAVVGQGGSSSSNDPLGGGGGGGLFGHLFRLPGWCKRQKVSPPADQEPPSEAPHEEPIISATVAEEPPPEAPVAEEPPPGAPVADIAAPAEAPAAEEHEPVAYGSQNPNGD